MTVARAVRGPMAIGAGVVLALAVLAGGAITLRLAILAVLLGGVIGLVAAGLLHARYGAARAGVARSVLEAAALCFAIESFVVAWGMATSPILYAARWYAEGGVWRTLQLLASDTLGAHGVVLVAFALAVAYVGPRRIVGRARWFVAAAVVVLAGSWIHASSRSSAAPPAAVPVTATATATASGAKPNVLLVVVEGLRADRLDPRTAPTLDRLAARGARFDGAYASTPERLPGLGTLLTGRYAHHHGLRSEEPPPEALARDLDALPARLARAGYATAALGDDGTVLRRLDLGFAEVAAPARDARDESLARQTPLLPLLATSLGRRFFPAQSGLREGRDPRRLADDAARRMHVLKQRPFLLTVAFSTVEAPYVAPAEYSAKYMDRGYRGRFRYLQDGEAPAEEADRVQIRALYDGSVRAVDDGVARLLEALGDEEIAGNTIVVVTSEHGERLFEHGRGQGHDGDLAGDESLHVPLVVFDPRRATPLRSKQIVRDVDVAATIYALTAVSAPADLDGRSLVPLLDHQSEEPRLAFAEGGTPVAGPSDPAQRLPAALGVVARQRVVRDGTFALVYTPTRQRVEYQLFDTVHDRAAAHDLARARPDVAARLNVALLRWMLSDPFARLAGEHVVPGEPAPHDVVWLTAPASTPAIDELAKHGVRFTQAYPAGPPVPRGQLPIAPDAAPDAPRSLVVVVVEGAGGAPSQLVLVAPGKLPAGRVIDTRVRDVDLVPTVAELLGLDLDTPPGSRSLVALANGQEDREVRPIVTVRPGVQTLLYGDRRLVVRDAGAQLFDAADLTLQRDLTKQEPERVDVLRARLTAALANVPVAGSREPPPRVRTIHLRFATAGRAQRVSGALTAADGSTLTVTPVELGKDSFKVAGTRAEIAFTTSAGLAVGFDVVVDPPGADLAWDLYLDDHAWPEDAVFGGRYGLLDHSLHEGITTDAARASVTSAVPPVIDPRRDLGLFVDRK